VEPAAVEPDAVERAAVECARQPAPDAAGVLAAAPLPLVVTTPDARVLLANRAMQRLLGVPVVDVSGRFLAEFAGPPHGRLRRLAAVAASAAHPVTTEISLSLGRRRSIAVRVVVARGVAAGGEPFLVWQVTSSPTAHALPEVGAGEPPSSAAAAATDAADVPAATVQADLPAATDPVPARTGCYVPVPPAGRPDPHALTLEMIRTPADQPVEDVAERLAALAGQAFGALPVRIALDVAVARTPVAAATDPVATLAALAEAELGGTGPVTAAASGSTVAVGDLGHDARFGTAGPEIARRLGISSVLAAPLRRGDAVVGSLAVYSDAAEAFDDSHVWLADWVAAVVGGVLESSVRFNAAATESRQLRTAMASRAVIEQAKGILMARHRVDEDAAFAMLRVTSQTRNRRLRDVASGVVAEAAAPPAQGQEDV
jgi:hypothetical protein